VVALNVERAAGPGVERLELVDPHVVICGFTGRDPAEVAAHIAELGEIGVAPPETTPLFMTVPGDLLQQPDSKPIEVQSADTSGEAEPVLVRIPGRGDYVGVGSDHTDRGLEAESILAGKTACPKLISPSVWPFEDVADRWDSLRLTATVDGTTVLDGRLAHIRPPMELLGRAADAVGLPDDRPSVLFLGTLSSGKAATDPHGRSPYVMTLRDAITGRALICAYEVHNARTTQAGEKEVAG
jgi:hypothetical protein